jgi:hypothetical protein
MTPQISDATFEYARECLSEDVDALLDDPVGVIADGSLLVHVADLHAIAADLGVDLDKMLNARGSEFERLRIRQMLDAELCSN